MFLSAGTQNSSVVLGEDVGLVIPFFLSKYLSSFQDNCCVILILTSSHYTMLPPALA
jgi:hypothetical protein